VEDVGEYVVSCSDDLCFHGHGMVGAVRYAFPWLPAQEWESANIFMWLMFFVRYFPWFRGSTCRSNVTGTQFNIYDYGVATTNVNTLLFPVRSLAVVGSHA